MGEHKQICRMLPKDLLAQNWSGEMSVLKPEYNECGVMTAYVNSQGHLQHVAATGTMRFARGFSLRIIKRMKRSAQKPDKIGFAG
jgi:hypothetical protein